MIHSFDLAFHRHHKIHSRQSTNSHWVWFSQQQKLICQNNRIYKNREYRKAHKSLLKLGNIYFIRNICSRITTSWKSAARLAFIENQIQTCIAIQSPAELEHWYSVLGGHLAKYCDEKRIRTHLDELLGTPDDLMMLDNESVKKDTILVIRRTIWLEMNMKIFHNSWFFSI